MSTFYARIKNQYKFKYQTIFSARFNKQNEDNQVVQEIELYINQNNVQSLTESDIIVIHNKSHLDLQIEYEEMKESALRID